MPDFKGGFLNADLNGDSQHKKSPLKSGVQKKWKFMKIDPWQGVLKLAWLADLAVMAAKSANFATFWISSTIVAHVVKTPLFANFFKTPLISAHQKWPFFQKMLLFFQYRFQWSCLNCEKSCVLTHCTAFLTRWLWGQISREIFWTSWNSDPWSGCHFLTKMLPDKPIYQGGFQKYFCKFSQKRAIFSRKPPWKPGV